MTEVLHDQNEHQNPRPIGRFLLGLTHFEAQQNYQDYAKAFARRPGNFQKYRHSFSKVDEARELIVNERSVQLEFSIDRYAYIWKIIIAAERHRTDDIHTNYLPHGGEEYELHCSRPKSHGTYSEKGVQGKAIRERTFESEETLQKLQGVVEWLLHDELNNDADVRILPATDLASTATVLYLPTRKQRSAALK